MTKKLEELTGDMIKKAMVNKVGDLSVILQMPVQGLLLAYSADSRMNRITDKIIDIAKYTNDESAVRYTSAFCVILKDMPYTLVNGLDIISEIAKDTKNKFAVKEYIDNVFCETINRFEKGQESLDEKKKGVLQDLINVLRSAMIYESKFY